MLVAGAGVEQGGRAGDVFQRRQQPIEFKRFTDFVAAQCAGDAHEEMLWRLDHQTLLRMTQQVAVVHRAQTEILEAARRQRIDRVVQLARVDGDEVAQAIVEDAQLGAARDGLREALDFLSAHFFVDVGAQQARRELAVLGFLGGQRGSGADRQLVQLLRGGAVVQAADGLQRDAQRVDPVQTFAAAGYCTHDLADVDDLLAAVALGHAHLGGVVRWRQRECGFRCGRFGDGCEGWVDARACVLAFGGIQGLHGWWLPAWTSNACSLAQGLIAMGSGGGAQAGHHAAPCSTTHFPAEAVTTHRDTFVPVCRQVFGLADRDLCDPPTCARFPAHEGQCMWVRSFPLYRCGAVPELHRIPF